MIQHSQIVRCFHSIWVLLQFSNWRHLDSRTHRRFKARTSRVGLSHEWRRIAKLQQYNTQQNVSPQCCQMLWHTMILHWWIMHWNQPQFSVIELSHCSWRALENLQMPHELSFKTFRGGKQRHPISDPFCQQRCLYHDVLSLGNP